MIAPTLQERLHLWAVLNGGSGAAFLALTDWWLSGLTLVLLAALCIAASLALGEEE